MEFYLFDRIFTHFEKKEEITTLVGKLQDELDRGRADLDGATPASVFIFNEVFNSTSARDGLSSAFGSSSGSRRSMRSESASPFWTSSRR